MAAIGKHQAPVVYKVLLAEGIHASAVAILRDGAEGVEFEVEQVDGAIPEDELLEKVKGVHVLGVRNKTPITRAVFEATKGELKVVGCFCIGTDHVDLSAAGEHKAKPLLFLSRDTCLRQVIVFNSPYANSRSVAELCLSHVISLSRQVPDRNREMHDGRWEKTAVGCFEVRGKVLGIVGYGHIGSQLSVLAEGLGMRVVYHDVVQVLPRGNAMQLPTLEAVLGQSDFVTLFVPGGPSSRGMMGREQIMSMKKGSSLINASRGTVVDLEALAEAVRCGHLGGAAIDVFPEEPLVNGSFEGNGIDIPLRGLPNVILTPHIGGSTQEAQAAIGAEVAHKVVTYLATGKGIATCVNLVALAERSLHAPHSPRHV